MRQLARRKGTRGFELNASGATIHSCFCTPLTSLEHDNWRGRHSIQASRNLLHHNQCRYPRSIICKFACKGIGCGCTLKALDLKLTTMQSSIHNCVIEDLGSTVAMIGHLWLEHQLSNRTSLILQEHFVPDLQVSLPAAKTCQTSLKKRCTTNVLQSQQKKMKRTCVNTGRKMNELYCNKLLVSCLV